MMSVNDESAASRRFVAHPPFWGSKMASKTTPAYQNNPVKYYVIFGVAIIALCFVLYIAESAFVGSRHGFSADIADKGFRYGGVVVLLVGLGAYYWWSQRRKILIGVTSDRLSVNKRPGDVFRLSDAKLGTLGSDWRHDDGYGASPAVWPAPLHPRRTRSSHCCRNTARSAGRGLRAAGGRRRLVVGLRLR